MAEQALVDELEGGRRRLLTEDSEKELLKAIRQQMETITTNLYVVRWIPEQGEDLYDVLVDGTSVAHVEIPRGGAGEAVCQLLSLDDYRRRAASFTKQERRKFDLALQLAIRT
jgi:hypothetical protein